MSNHPIQVFGVTPISQFPKCPPQHPCTEFCEIDKLCIPSSKITTESVRQVCLKVCINSCKTISTPAGKKLVINGEKQIKIFFVPDDPRQMIQSTDFEIPFCTFILLKDIQDEVAQICSVVEDISVKYLDCRCLTVTSIIFVCPVFRKGHELCPCPPDHTTKSHFQPSHGMTEFDCHDKQQCTCHHDSQWQPHHFQPICKNCQSQWNH